MSILFFYFFTDKNYLRFIKIGKAILHGSLQDRLHQLNKKETELLQEIEKKNKVNKQLQEDRIYYRNKCDEKE